ncbi:MAG: ATP-binding protein, partial [Coriobacteriales bacterium]|nr:ATP-binding protein [Coriobacteriales bacterium]
MFVGREVELKEMDTLFAKTGFQMVVVYGRRRVGKTTLIAQFAAKKPHIYFTAQESNDAENLKAFSRALYAYAGLPSSTGSFDTWADALAFLGDLAKDRRLVLAFDEFPYAAQANKSLPSILQNVIDHTLLKGQLYLVLSGSNVGFMESDVLGSKSPLYGRRTAQIHLLPFDYLDASKMLKGVSAEDCVRYYTCMGGVPYYLGFVDGTKSFDENIINLFFGRTSVFSEEPLMMLRQELREPALYNTILMALAKGANTPQLIANTISEDRTKVMKYIGTLVDLGLVEKRVPLLSNQAKTRKGVYRIADPLFAFWYRYVFPLRGEVELGAGELLAKKKVLPVLPELEGIRFEDVCLQWLRRKNLRGELPFVATALGSWWGTDPRSRQQSDVDVMAAEASEKKLLLGECKWRESLQAGTTLNTL